MAVFASVLLGSSLQFSTVARTVVPAIGSYPSAAKPINFTSAGRLCLAIRTGVTEFGAGQNSEQSRQILGAHKRNDQTEREDLQPRRLGDQILQLYSVFLALRSTLCELHDAKHPDTQDT